MTNPIILQASLVPRLWPLSTIYHKKAELLEGKIDSRSGTGEVQAISNSNIIQGFFFLTALILHYIPFLLFKILVFLIH